ncbi:MAG: sigma-70 family RNA polymerase sigma factor [Nocardioidaceae bacterium]
MDRDQDFSAYVDARWSGLVGAALLLGADQPGAEALARAALLRCYRSWDDVRRNGDADTYAYRLLASGWSHHRRRVTGEPVPPEEPARAEGTVRVQPRTDLRAELAALPAEQRTVVVLRVAAELSPRQVAEALGVSEATVESRLARGLESLQGRVSETDGRALLGEARREVSPPPELVSDARRGVTRHRVGASLVALAAAVLVAGLVWQLPGRVETGPSPGPGPVKPPTSRVVGMGRLAVVVPASWGTNNVRCGVAIAATVVFDSERPAEPCSYVGAVAASVHFVSSTSVHAVPFLKAATSVRALDGFALLTSPLSTSGQPRMFSQAVVLPANQVLMWVQARSRAVVRRIVGSVRIVEPNHVAIPFDANGPAQATRAEIGGTGLRVVQDEVPSSLAPGSLVGTSPAVGTVVPVGSTVTVLISTRDRPVYPWAELARLGITVHPAGGARPTLDRAQALGRAATKDQRRFDRVGAVLRRVTDTNAGLVSPEGYPLPVTDRLVWLVFDFDAVAVPSGSAGSSRPPVATSATSLSLVDARTGLVLLNVEF